MATINTLSWNVEVFGPKKYGNSANNVLLVRLIAQVAVTKNANILVLMELTSSVAEQVCFSVCEALTYATGNPWSYFPTPARPDGNKESYGVLWQTNGPFQVVTDGAGQRNLGLSTVDFPNNFSGTHGRRAAIATFRTTDTNNNFTVAVYHAPPNQQAILGLERLAQTPGLYGVNNAGANQAVNSRLLGGDYNLNVNVQPEYAWLTNPVPVPPPPASAGPGAGTTPITTALTHLANMTDAVNLWGSNLANWSVNPVAYRDTQLDNIFYSAAAVVGGGPVDLIAAIMNPASGERAIAQNFTTIDPVTQQPAFPFAFSLPLPLNLNLSLASCAWLLTRYGVSDHLPVFASVTI